MTHEELSALRDQEDWDALWPEAQIKANFSIEQIAHGATDKDSSDFDEDVCQVGYEAAFEALATWEPARGALDTHIKAQVQGVLLDYWRTEKTGGIGSKWVTEQGAPAEHASMSTPTGDDRESDDPPTWLHNLTYANTTHVPIGFGSIEQELARESVDDSIRYFMHGLSPEDAALARRVISEEQPALEYAAELGLHHSTIQYRVKQLQTKFRNRAKTCYVLGKGITDWKGLQSHYPVRKRYPHFWSDAGNLFTENPVWSEATGKVWNDWHWRPDIETSAAIERGDRKARGQSLSITIVEELEQAA